MVVLYVVSGSGGGGSGAVGVVDRKEAVRAGDKQACGGGTLVCLGGQALLVHNNG